MDHVAIHYDPIPTSESYEQNKELLSYSGGELVAVVVKPLPPGFFYEQPRDYRLFVADQWQVAEGRPIRVAFDLARAVDDDGVYTVSVIAKTGVGDETFEAASHSVSIDL
jgi:hypothetical protein